MAICPTCGEDPCNQNWRCTFEGRRHAAIVDQLRRAGWENWEAEEEADRLTAPKEPAP